MNRMPVTPGLDELCPHCNVAVGDHTIRGWGDCLHARGANLEMPYQDFEDGPIRMPALGDRVPVGEIFLKAGALDSALGRLPIVMFSFMAVGTKPMQRIPTPEYALILDERGMHGCKELVNRTINAAIREARR